MRTSRAQVPLLYHPRLAGKQTRFPCAILETSDNRAKNTNRGIFDKKQPQLWRENFLWRAFTRDPRRSWWYTGADRWRNNGFSGRVAGRDPPRGPPDKSRFGAALIKTATRVWLLNTRKRDHFFGGERKNKRCRLLEAGRNGVFRVDRSSLNWNCI